MSEKEYSWSVKLDWLNILNKLGLESIKQISELKKDKAIKKLTRNFGNEALLEREGDELDKLVAQELKELMRKELSLKAKKEERLEKELHSKVIPFKRGGIIKIDPRDFKDLDIDFDNPEEFFKALYKKFTGKDDGEDEDDDKNKFSEDSTGYYI